MSRRFQIPFVRRSEYDRLWRENAELRNALKNANEDRRKLRLIVEDRRFGVSTTSTTVQ